MFGKRSSAQGASSAAVPAPAAKAIARTMETRAPQPSRQPEPQVSVERVHSEDYYQTKGMIFGALIEAIDLTQLSKLDAESAREEIRDIINEIISLKNLVMSIAEQEELLADICNDVLGYGPLEPLLARDDISDIMVNGAGRTFIEVAGKIQLTGIRFRDNQQLMNICQRIVSQVGRRVDESSPICDARLPDGSRVNVIAPPLAIDGPTLTIRKFKKDKLTLDQLVRFGAISPEGAEILKIIGKVRCNIVISGGTGSGKTTLLNCLTNYIEHDERVITCEEVFELKVPLPDVVSMQTRQANLEGTGEIALRRLVKEALRMRPDRIIVGEVRQEEALDLLIALNSGLPGMCSIHANSAREAIVKLCTLPLLAGENVGHAFVVPTVASCIDIVVHTAKDGTGHRRVREVVAVPGRVGRPGPAGPACARRRAVTWGRCSACCSAWAACWSGAPAPARRGRRPAAGSG
mgnify:CR=1 FL=1